MFGIKSFARQFGWRKSLTIAIISVLMGMIGMIIAKVSLLEFFGLNINEITMPFTFGFTIHMCMSRWKNSTSGKVIYMKKKDFFQLVKLSMDISTEVLRKFMDSRILSNAKYGGCLLKFLDVEKHYLYHQWQGSTPCCKCPAVGCTLRKSKKFKNWLFKTVYNGNPQQGIHVEFNGHRISQYCLDCFVPIPALNVNHFDVTILSFFIEHFARLSPKEMSSLNDVISVRNSICHAMNTSSFHSKELESMWTKLSEALLILTDPPSRNLLKDQISILKKVEFDGTDIEILKEKVEREGKMLEEICKFMNQNGVTKDCIKETEGRIVTHINTKTEGIQDDVKALKEGQLEFAHQQEKTDDKLGIVIQMLNAIKMEFHLYAEKKGITKDDSGELTERLIDAVGRIENENIDERLVVENITKSSDTDDNQKFKVVSAKQSCIILYLECSPNVLQSEQSFRSAVKSLLSDIVQAGNIDTGSPLTIVFKLKFCSPLTDDEINLIKRVVGKTADVTPSSTLRERDQSKVWSIQDKREFVKKLEVYKISSLESQVLELTKKIGIIILTDESYIPTESDIEIRLWDDSNFHLVLPAKVIKNVIEFEIPWDKCSLDRILHDHLYVSVYDKKMKIETSKQTVKLMSSGHTEKGKQMREIAPRKQHKKSKTVYGSRDKYGSPETSSEGEFGLSSKTYRRRLKILELLPTHEKLSRNEIGDNMSRPSSTESGFRSDIEPDNNNIVDPLDMRSYPTNNDDNI